MILFTAFFVLLNISIAAPTSNKQKIITPDSYSLGQVFYTASSSWDNVVSSVLIDTRTDC